MVLRAASRLSSWRSPRQLRHVAPPQDAYIPAAHFFEAVEDLQLHTWLCSRSAPRASILTCPHLGTHSHKPVGKPGPSFKGLTRRGPPRIISPIN